MESFSESLPGYYLAATESVRSHAFLRSVERYAHHLERGYSPTHDWTLGYGTRYVSERNVSSGTRAKLDAYWAHNAMLAYKVNHNLDLQLNVNNLFDKDYVERVRQQSGSTTRSSAIE
nr:TonB-dependent receptor [Pseudomonas sp. SBT1-2]